MRYYKDKIKTTAYKKFKLGRDTRKPLKETDSCIYWKKFCNNKFKGLCSYKKGKYCSLYGGVNEH